MLRERIYFLSRLFGLLPLVEILFKFHLDEPALKKTALGQKNNLSLPTY